MCLFGEAMRVGSMRKGDASIGLPYGRSNIPGIYADALSAMPDSMDG